MTMNILSPLEQILFGLGTELKRFDLICLHGICYWDLLGKTADAMLKYLRSYNLI